MDIPPQRDSIEDETQRHQEQQDTGGSIDGAANETNENMISTYQPDMEGSISIATNYFGIDETSIESQSQGDEEALMPVPSASTTVGGDELLDVEELLPSIENLLIRETENDSIQNVESRISSPVNMILGDYEEEGDQSQSEDYDNTEVVMAELSTPSEDDISNRPGGSSQYSEQSPFRHFINTRAETYLRESDQLCSVKDAPVDDPENAVHFNKDLPAEHSYLGSDMTRLTGETYFKVGREHTITLFMHRHVLFPGEILPFLTERNLLETCGDSQNGFMIGVCFPAIRGATRSDELYGVTCRIFESGPCEINTSNAIYVKCCAMQRFVVKRSQVTGPRRFIDPYPHVISKGIIRIIPECFLPEPAQGLNMGSMNRFRGNDYMQQWFRRYQAAGTPHPPHVYKAYASNMPDLLERARGYLAQHQIYTMPADPIRLSFWLARNLHFSDGLVRNLFKLDSVNKRFKLMSVANDENFVFVCVYCRNRIAECRHMVAMSKYGVQAQYLSEDGTIFEVNTVSELVRDSTILTSCTRAEFSWFPGYVRQNLICKTCLSYIGWKFNSMNPKMQPRYFYAISTPVRILKSLLNIGRATINVHRTYNSPGPSNN